MRAARSGSGSASGVIEAHHPRGVDQHQSWRGAGAVALEILRADGHRHGRQARIILLPHTLDVSFSRPPARRLPLRPYSRSSLVGPIDRQALRDRRPSAGSRSLGPRPCSPGTSGPRKTAGRDGRAGSARVGGRGPSHSRSSSGGAGLPSRSIRLMFLRIRSRSEVAP